MNRIARTAGAVVVIATIAGCFDPDPVHYETPLPNGLRHVSNGGEQGSIGTPSVNNFSTTVYPVEDDWYCNEFAVLGDDVIGVEIQYAERAFVDPPVARRWFFLNTHDRTASTFDSLDALRKHCAALGHAAVPEFARRTSNTVRMSFE